MAEQRWTAPESGWYQFGFGELPPESADVQSAEFENEPVPGEFPPAGLAGRCGSGRSATAQRGLRTA